MHPPRTPRIHNDLDAFDGQGGFGDRRGKNDFATRSGWRDCRTLRFKIHRTEQGRQRTGMAVQRTRMAADRTLMAEVRTSLSMIGFGFTIYQTFESLAKSNVLNGGNAPRNFSLLLILLGMLILVGGIWRHIQFALELRARRAEMSTSGLIHGTSRYPVSVSLIVAIGLLIVGCMAALNILFGLTLFGGT